jgi:hypothetical protein
MYENDSKQIEWEKFLELVRNWEEICLTPSKSSGVDSMLYCESSELWKWLQQIEWDLAGSPQHILWTPFACSQLRQGIKLIFSMQPQVYWTGRIGGRDWSKKWEYFNCLICKGCPSKNVPFRNLIFVITQLLGVQSSKFIPIIVGDRHKNGNYGYEFGRLHAKKLIYYKN